MKTPPKTRKLFTLLIVLFFFQGLKAAGKPGISRINTFPGGSIHIISDRMIKNIEFVSGAESFTATMTGDNIARIDVAANACLTDEAVIKVGYGKDHVARIEIMVENKSDSNILTFELGNGRSFGSKVSTKSDSEMDFHARKKEKLFNEAQLFLKYAVCVALAFFVIVWLSKQMFGNKRA